jgi:hypothetical protein
MEQNKHVRHPKEVVSAKRQNVKQDNKFFYANNMVVEWITNHILASVVLFDIAFIVPLLTITAPSSVKITLGVISGSWIQWWALPALQKSQNRAQIQQDAKAETDHEALTYMVNLQEKQMTELEAIKDKLSKS